MTESSLTTAREREEFRRILRDFEADYLEHAPREHLHAIERVMAYWRPVADHRTADRPIYGANGCGPRA
jgi:hypothetical protein